MCARTGPSPPAPTRPDRSVTGLAHCCNVPLDPEGASQRRLVVDRRHRWRSSHRERQVAGARSLAAVPSSASILTAHRDADGVRRLVSPGRRARRGSIPRAAGARARFRRPTRPDSEREQARPGRRAGRGPRSPPARLLLRPAQRRDSGDGAGVIADRLVATGAGWAGESVLWARPSTTLRRARHRCGASGHTESFASSQARAERP